jgi:hypothetical protein
LYGNKSVALLETMGHRRAAEVEEWMKSAWG